jgi:pimeloyl-ACP methyl ester carboxylesterase
MHKRWFFSGALALVCLQGLAPAQVIVHSTRGTRERGERVLPVGDDAYRLEVYRGFGLTIPKQAVAMIEDPPAPEWRPQATALPAKARLDAEERAALDRLVTSYFEAADSPDDQAAILATLRQQDTVPAEDLAGFRSRIWDLARSGRRLAPGTQRFTHPQFPGEVNVEVVAGDPAGGPLPLFLALHGGGENDGHWRSGTDMFTKPARAVWKRGIFVCPSVLHKKYAEWGRNPVEEHYVKELLKAAKRTWDVDTDRIYIGGHSMGGYGAWHIGGHQADMFAGVISAAGGILTGRSIGESWGWGVLGNLRHTPVAFLHGTKDEPSPVWSDQESSRILGELEKAHPGQYRHRYVETVNGGHMPPGKPLKESVEWILEHERNPAPKELTWEPTRSFIKHFYWLRVEKPAMFQRIEARIEGNTITVAATRLTGGFSLLLNERLVDLAQPVEVLVNGRQAFRGHLHPRVSAVLESIDDKVDDRLVYTTRIDF